MVNIGDILSESVRSNLIFKSAEIGDVFRLKFEPKYFVILGIDDAGNAFGFVVINSVINQHLPLERRNLHYQLKSSKYSFLEGKDRFVDCSDFKQISKIRFTELFGNNSLRGKIDDEDLQYIKDAVVSYEDAPKKILKRFGLI